MAVLRIQLDDGRDFRLDRNVLIGPQSRRQRGRVPGPAAGGSGSRADHFQDPPSPAHGRCGRVGDGPELHQRQRRHHTGRRPHRAAAGRASICQPRNHGSFRGPHLHRRTGMNSQQAASTPRAGREPGLSLSYGYGTDRGLRRELNEDSFIASDPVFAVADGMGGHEAGEVASGMCVRALARHAAAGHGGADSHGGRGAAVPGIRADDSIRAATGSRAGHHAERRGGGGADGRSLLAGHEHRRFPDVPAEPRAGSPRSAWTTPKSRSSWTPGRSRPRRPPSTPAGTS